MRSDTSEVRGPPADLINFSYLGERVRVESVTLSGFRCFGPGPMRVEVSPAVTAIVGPNGAGKTAFLHALSKLFGVSQAQRTLHRSDFHVAVGEKPEDRSSKELSIDVLLGFPELTDGSATKETIAPSFRHMLIEEAGKCPVCRMRLQAEWVDDGTADGAVSQELFWVRTLEVSPAVEELSPVSAPDRGLIHLYYTPASRAIAVQVQATANSLATRLFRAIEWSSSTKDSVQKAGEDISTAFEAESAIDAICQALQSRWSGLHDEVFDTKPRLSVVSRRFEEVISKLAIVFEQGPDGRERPLDALSDGQQSLFYFALAAAVFDLERKVVAGKIKGFNDDTLRIPALTIFAMEEPENHLSPFYLARIIRQIRSLTDGKGAQALITSHSPAVMSRVDPREVRHCRCEPSNRVSKIRKIKLPSKASAASKFIRGALLAYPELYFARFTLLVEGDSEQIVLPRLAEALGLLIDPAFVSIVPLGGRHVEHFWRLLANLGIPYATLLDLDLGRSGAGFGRVKTTIKHLIKAGVSKESLLESEGGKLLSDKQLESMHTWQSPTDVNDLQGWVDSLQPHGVYFSTPLDLDLSMLEAFPEAYNGLIPKGGGPETSVIEATKTVLGKSGPGLTVYSSEFKRYKKLLPAHLYHFSTHSKPATHLAALANVTNDELRKKMPPVLAELLKHISKELKRH